MNNGLEYHQRSEQHDLALRHTEIGSIRRIASALITVEVLIAKVIRKVLNMGNRGVLELAFIHAVSLPMMGGFSAMFGKPLKYGMKNMEAFKDGAKGIPAVFAAQYITNVANRGFQIPKVSVKEILVTAASKMLSKPLINVMFDKLPKAVMDNFTIQLLMEAKQAAASNLRMN